MTGATPPRERLRFGPERRIRSKAQYEGLLRGGTRRTFSGFTFIVTPNDVGSARLGVLMSLRVSRRANVRNRVKRCIREAFRLEQRALAPVDVLVRPPQNIRLEHDMLGRLRDAFSRLKR
ncbi:MAG: ribonuclease P protein component [Betaproteobacteria bacterium]|nr:ribonuclease P protein component [Betaproteobacteria bacterium]